MQRIFNESGSERISLPIEGIHDLSGNLFHHACIMGLLPVHYDRLAEHGITVSSKRFSHSEDEKLKDNWKRFAADNSLKDDDIYNFVSVGQLKMTGRNSKACRDLFKGLNFWPRMCEGLLARTAIGVKSRLCILFDPFKSECRDFTPEEEQTLLYYMRRKVPPKHIAYNMSKACIRIFSHILVLKRRELFTKSERRHLWKVAERNHDKYGQDLFDYDGIDFAKIGRHLTRNVDVIRKEWKNIRDEIHNRLLEGCDWKTAFESAVPVFEKISASELGDFVQLFIDEVPPKNSRQLRLSRSFQRTFYEKMLEIGLTGFYTTRYGELAYCIRLVGQIMGKIRRNVLEKAGIHLPFTTELKLVLGCCRRISACHDKRLRFKRNVVVSELIKLRSEDDKLWKPSKKLRKYLDEIAL